ncbi:cation:proton antiporter [Rubritalea marina]|uniref:cation:proton antiporter n=1 Tax=Rubritalea marina TaxID=361055 RepID=UPI000A04AA7A|nr:cation:proton antiporter [Rubritalea marina]
MFSLLAAGSEIPPFFVLLTIVLLAVVLVSLFLVRAKQSLLVGYFLCGILINNSGLLGVLGLEDVGAIDALAEIGVVLLLFTLGIEFSLKEMKALRMPIFVGGGVQVAMCVLVGFLVGAWYLDSWSLGLLLGFVLALSSTAVSMKSFEDLGMPESPQARTALGMAIFQDLGAILFMVLIPPIVSQSSGETGLGAALVKGLLFTLSIILLSRKGFPEMLDAVARTRSRELFTLTVIGLCAAVALASGLLGLSPALGAFAAGVVVSESIYSHRVLSDILPFKDLFLTVFFVSVGLLIDLGVLMDLWVEVLLFSAFVLVVKALIVAWAAKLSGLRRGNWMVTAAALCSTGEFSIVLLARAQDFEALPDEVAQVILVSSALTMGLVPVLMKYSLGWAKAYYRWTRGGRTVPENHTLGMSGHIREMNEHVIICGFGPVGRNLYENLQLANIDCLVVEMNPETVKRLQREGVCCLFGDVQDMELLLLARIRHAQAIAYTFANDTVAMKSLKVARELSHDLRVYARANFGSQVAPLQRAGVDFVLYDEEQSGRALIRSVMQGYDADIEPVWQSPDA